MNMNTLSPPPHNAMHSHMDDDDDAASTQPPPSPAMSDFSNMDDDELDLYLASCVPMSNLPTPPTKLQSIPPGHRNLHPALCTPALQTPPPELDVQHPASELQVYASHLVDLVPGENDDSDVVNVVEGFLRRANLPIEMYAFAGCILEMLEARLGASEGGLVILAALALAHGYLDDRGRSNRHWAVIEAAGRFDAHEVQRVKMSILSDMDFGLFRISDSAVKGMVTAMQNRLPGPCISMPGGSGLTVNEDDGWLKSGLSTSAPGQAIWTFGVQTPEPSP
ncbi:unnamed protein product [Periconia digitata]|uniref:Cyclin N-terminal domain-containing protein n=1 Tax=Periconia digitata TaxID=1303443 RepID=A0A9W4XCW8_9PLEO|nr:unnamed protein product [Periconia digitata]